MKKVILLLCFFIYLFTDMAAQQNPDITGIYSSTSRSPEGTPKLMVFPDGFYMIPYFGGVQVGNWSFSGKTSVVFNPYYIKERFLVYGRRDKTLKDSVRVYFVNCRDVATYIGFVQKNKFTVVLQRVFNQSANCVPWPNVYTFPIAPTNTMVLRTYAIKDGEGTTPQTFLFSQNEGYNDFVVTQYLPSSANDSFVGVIKNGELVFGEMVSWESKKQQYEEDEETLDFIEKMKHLIKAGVPDTFFYNAGYNEFGSLSNDINGYAIDSVNYRLDTVRNAWVAKRFTEQELELPREERYHDNRIIHFFKRLNNVTSTFKKFEQKEKPLFYFTCNNN